MPRPKKTETNVLAESPPTEGTGVPVLAWISLAKVAGGFAVLKASTRGHDVLGVEVLAGPLGRSAASAALRVEVARQFLVGRGPR